MKIWIVLEGDYDGDLPMAAFATETEADAEAARLRSIPRVEPYGVPCGYSVFECELRGALPDMWRDALLAK